MQTEFPKSEKLRGIRVLAAINGLELYGHERENLLVLSCLQAMGAEVLLCVNERNHGGDVFLRARELGIKTDTLPFGNQWSWLWLKKYPMSIFEKLGQVIRCAWRFGKFICAFKPTHVHIGSPLVYSFIFPAVLLWRGKMIYRMGDYPPTDSWFNLPLWKSAVNRANHVVTISNYISHAAANIGGKKIATKTRRIYGYKNHALKNPIEKNKFVIGYVGRLSAYKGVFDLLHAFENVSKKYDQAELVFVGSGDGECELKKLVAEKKLNNKVKFLGYIDQPAQEVSTWVFQVTPSLCNEALGVVVIEAKALGIPVVIYPRGGLPEMVRHKIDGYICSEENTTALIEALEWMLQHKMLLPEMGRNALSDVQQRFNRDNFMSSWAEIYLI